MWHRPVRKLRRGRHYGQLLRAWKISGVAGI